MTDRKLTLVGSNEDDRSIDRFTEDDFVDDRRSKRVLDQFDDVVAPKDDVDAFAAAFRAVPKEERDDGIRRALNLIPDENALLLAGVLMDKAQEKDIVELVFNDVLNRGDEVKMPMLRQIFKDKSHPCWADAAWIFDATGEDSRE